MKQKLIKVISVMCSVPIICLIIYMFWYRITFGVLNPFSMPDRIDMFGRRYYITWLAPTDTVNNPNALERVNWPVNKTFKTIYMDTSNIGTCPARIYLLTRDGKYKSYSLSGSN